MDITSDRFHVEVIEILQRIAESHFIAFDLEFSGVAGRRRGPGGVSTGKLTLQEYYHDIKAAAEKYQTLQVGLTIVVEDVQAGRYIAYPYNFNINPLPTLRERQFGREWSFHSGAIQFLLKNGFRFDLPLTRGIPYLSRAEEMRARNNMIEQDDIRSKLADMEIKEADQILIQHIREEVDKWQNQPKDNQESFVNIPSSETVLEIPPSLNRYQMRLTHQIVKNEYPGLKTHGCGHFIQITNPTAEQITSEKAFKDEQREKDLSKAIGFRWIMEAIVGGDMSNMPADYLLGLKSNNPLSNNHSPREIWRQLQHKLQSRRKILVGHNCFTDLVNLYKCFFGILPETVEEFASEIHRLFPGMIDTKCMASFGNKRWGNTSLEDVEIELRSEIEPRIVVPGDFDRYQYEAIYHEAGYDSLLTAKIAIKLPAQMEKDGAYREGLAGELDETFSFGGQFVDAAPQQISQLVDEDAQTSPITKSVMDVLSKPAETLKTMAVGKVDKVGETQKPETMTDMSITDIKPEVLISRPAANATAVVAVREKHDANAGRWSKRTEIEEIKSNLSTKNIYDALERDSAGDLAEPSSQTGSRKTRIKTEKDIEKMVKRGSLMPRWEKDGAFWQLFGNKLQVNGSREGYCLLK